MTARIWYGIVSGRLSFVRVRVCERLVSLIVSVDPIDADRQPRHFRDRDTSLRNGHFTGISGI